jgi:hypothetical protein
MKRKWLMITSTALLLTTIGMTTALAKNGVHIYDFIKEARVKQIQEGAEVDLPSQIDKEKGINSIDPKTGEPMLQLQPKVGNKEVFKKHLIAEDTGKTLDVPYVKNGTKEVAIYDPITTLLTVPIPDSNDYFIDFDGNIYKTDWAKGILKKFVHDEVNGYQKDEILSHKLDGVGTPVWATLPRLNPSATYLLFFSERSMVTGDKNGETWIKNILTGEEKPVLSGSGSLVGWVDDTTAIFQGITICAVNVKTGEVATLLDKVYDVGLFKDQLVYQIEPGTLIFQSVETGDITTVKNNLLHRSGVYQAQGDWLAIYNQVREGESEHSIVLYNRVSEMWKLISEPSDYMFTGALWQDDATILVQTHRKGNSEEYTFTVNINDLENVR